MNVLVITAAGLRPDYLGCYGCDWVDTPNLDQLAAAGIVFDNHHAVSPDTAGASAAWRTGKYFSDHGPIAERAKASQKDPDLLAKLAEYDVRTVLIASADRPPDKSFIDGWHKVHLTDSTTSLLETVDKALAQMARQKRSLVWIDIPVLLPPWQIPTDYPEAYFGSSQDEETDEDQEEEDEGEERDKHQTDGEDEPLIPLLNPPCGVDDSIEDETIERLQNTYAAGVTYLDSIVGQILELIAKVDPQDEWLLIVSSPHGLALGEHALVGTSPFSLHEEHIHVPLLMRLPSGAEAGRRISPLTQSIDLPATLLEFFGVNRPDMDGKSLLPLANGKAEILRSYSLSCRELDQGLEWSLRTPEWKLIVPPVKSDTPEGPISRLYAKPEDRFEVNNVAQHHHELMDELEQMLRALIESRKQV